MLTNATVGVEQHGALPGPATRSDMDGEARAVRERSPSVEVISDPEEIARIKQLKNRLRLDPAPPKST